MKVKQIIVDKLQENCKECIFHYKDSFSHMWCKPLQYKISGLSPNGGVPSWCPLVVEDVCEWKLTYCGKSEEACDYGEDLYLGEYKCTDGWYQGHKPDYTFCPNCGKRIVYKE